MFVAERLIYLQLQKTGCTHVAELLARCIPGRQIGKHNWLLRDARDKYIAGSVRNPWDWYVSLWAFGCGGRGGFRDRVTGRIGPRPPGAPSVAARAARPTSIVAGIEGIAEACPAEPAADDAALPGSNAGLWEATYGDSDSPELFRAWLRLVFDSRTRNDYFGPNGHRPLDDLVGLYTFRYLRMHCRRSGRLLQRRLKSMAELRRFDRDNNMLDGVIRNESLEGDLIRVLREAGYRPTRQQLDMIESASEDRQNASRHRAPGFYYDRATVELVARHEQLIIGKYAYQPPKLP